MSWAAVVLLSLVQVLSPQDVSKLDVGQRKIARAVGEYRSAPPDVSRYVPIARGTAWLIHTSGKRLVWITNHHVLDSIERAQFGTRGVGYIVADDGEVLPVEAALAASEVLDYAVVVTAAGARKRTPIPLQPDGVPLGKPIYVLSGYNSLNGLLDLGVLGQALGLRDRPARAVTVSEEGRDYFERHATDKRGQPLRTLVTGTYRGGTVMRTRLGMRRSERFDCKVAQGTSGSPIVSASTHKVVALLWGMDPAAGQTALATSIRLVIDDLKRKLAQGEIATHYRGLVGDFVRRR